MIESDLLQAISTVGFPIVMCFYLMVKFEKTLKKNTEALIGLKEVIRDAK